MNAREVVRAALDEADATADARAARAVARARAELDAVLAATAGTPFAVLLLDEAAHPLEACPNARRLLAAGRVLATVEEAATAAEPVRRAAFAKALGSARPRATAIVDLSAPGLPAWAAVDRAAHAAGFLDATPPVRVLVLDAAAVERDAAAAFAIRFRLSARERAVCEALVAGDDGDAAAARLGVSRETVRSHLKAIFRKSGYGSQGAVTQAALVGPRPTRGATGSHRA